MIVSLWVIIALQFIGTILTITQVGEPKPPITGVVAAFATGVSIFVILTLLSAIRTLA